ncbi:hypothetical protein AXX17_AT2G45910 [Arabidopsis thaliana]|uniref:Uncharacterized protein n=1 Tax=Arabidopsis thaliana TaxID=3702 RepID=A0A178W2T6_ARATH|nr:hypothetical protein AXX17_AT2G45910 [Arabidopsis thaliana]
MTKNKIIEEEHHYYFHFFSQSECTRQRPLAPISRHALQTTPTRTNLALSACGRFL